MSLFFFMVPQTRWQRVKFLLNPRILLLHRRPGVRVYEWWLNR